ncbi:MAG: GNAT family acetyltransferase [Pseudomonadota bacterium]
MSQFQIREVSDADVDAVMVLWEQCGLTRSWNDPRADIAFARMNDNSEVLGGWLDGALAASIMVGHDGHRGAVYYVSVHPDHQGTGLGRKLMDAAEAWLRKRGVWKLNLMVRADNQPVIDFYKSIGYEPEERANLSKWLDRAKDPASKS